MTAKHKKCPDCGWKIKMFSKTLKVVEGSRFKCPDCDKALIYRTGFGEALGPLATGITMLTLPMALYMMTIDDNRALQVKIFGVIVVLGILTILILLHFQHFEDDLAKEGSP